MQPTFRSAWGSNRELPLVVVRGRSRAADWGIQASLEMQSDQTGGGSEREKELAHLLFVSRFAEEYGEETGANLYCKSRSKRDTMFVEHMTSWRTLNWYVLYRYRTIRCLFRGFAVLGTVRHYSTAAAAEWMNKFWECNSSGGPGSSVREAGRINLL